MKALAHLLPPLALAALLMSPAAMTVHAQASTLALLTVPCSTAGTYTSSKFNVTGDQWMEITVEGATAGGGHPLCVDVDGYGTTAGSQVWAYPCTRSDDPTKQNERWNYTASDGLIRSAFPGAASNNMCAGMVNGAGILTLQPCTSPSGVHWTHTADGQLQLMDTRGMTGLGESGADPVCMVAQNISNVGCGSGGAFSTAAWCNTSLPFAARADAILAEASLGEVTAMMGNANSGIPRLAIPTNAFSECLHGVLTGCGAAAGPDSTGCPTSFPSALGMGASFNTTMFADVATAIGTEGRALNNQGVAGLTYWAPDINLFRDPRWGRGQEVSGEDPFLMAEYARNYIKHLQGEDDDKFFRVISTPKHFSSYDLEQWCDKSVDPPVCADRMNFNAIVSARDQAEYFFPAFRAAVTEGHAQSMMCSYNAVNGVPSCANGDIQNGIFRGQWGFDGFIVTDCGGISTFLPNHHNITADPVHAAAIAIAAGTDVNCGSIYQANLFEAVQAGYTTAAAVKAAAHRMFTAMISLGYLDPVEDQPYKQLGPQDVDSPEHRALALDVGRQSIVLLKNDGAVPQLPLSADAMKSVAVIGPHANATQALLSNYHGTNTVVNSQSPLQRLKARLGASAVTYAPGLSDVDSNDTSAIGSAAAAAKAAHTAVVFIGLGQNDEREGLDRYSLELPGAQLQLVQAVTAANPNTVVVLIHGGALAIEWVKANVPAIVDAHYPGEFGGEAITDVLVGDYNPSGRLTTTVYPAALVNRSMFNMNMRGDGGLTYLYYDGKFGAPLFTFGEGLSYTTFAYQAVGSAGGRGGDVEDGAVMDAVQLSMRTTDFAPAPGPRIAGSELLQGERDPVFAINVTNTGDVAGATSVLAFVNSTAASADGPPYPRLFGFGKVHLQPGESQVVRITSPAKVWCVYDAAGEACTLHPGHYTASFGGPAFAPGSATVRVALSGPAVRVL